MLVLKTKETHSTQIKGYKPDLRVYRSQMKKRLALLYLFIEVYICIDSRRELATHSLSTSTSTSESLYEHTIWIYDPQQSDCLNTLGQFSECGDTSMWEVASVGTISTIIIYEYLHFYDNHVIVR